ncbi:MAG: sigma-70 family RNA polymerase sigma factor [Myxococcota bacterium]
MKTPQPETNATRVEDALRANRSRLAAFVRARVPASDVDDVLQIAAVRAIEGAASLNDTERVLPWLYRIHRNVAADETRRRARHDRWVESDDAAPEVAAPVADSMCRCSVAQAKRMRPSYAAVINLVDIRGASLAEAARQLGISANNVAVRLHRARKALRQSMLEHCGVTSLRDCADCRCVHEGCCAA